MSDLGDDLLAQGFRREGDGTYDFQLDYAAVRQAVESAARARGYAFELVLRERSLRA
ncbi:MAG TPA: hypothetical protein VIU44_10990 [Gaiellaceae bacterium]